MMAFDGLHYLFIEFTNMAQNLQYSWIKTISEPLNSIVACEDILLFSLGCSQ